MLQDVIHANTRPEGPPRPVVLVLASALAQPNAGALVLREASGRDVVVLSEAHATLEQLWTARGALESDRRQNGWAVETDRRLVVPVARPVPPVPSRDSTMRVLEREHGAELEAVRGAPYEEVAGVGRARAVQIEPREPRR